MTQTVNFNSVNPEKIACDLVPVTPSDQDFLGFTALGLLVQPGRQIKIRTGSDEVRVIPVCVDNFRLDVEVKQVFETDSIPCRGDGAPWIWAFKPKEEN